MMRHVTLALVAVLVVAFSQLSRASASNRVVCMNIAMHDGRYNCPGDTGVPLTGSRTPNCDPGDTVGMSGVHVELWDMNAPPASDVYIEEYFLTSPGLNCVNFDWTNGSDQPDVYVKIRPYFKPVVGGAGLLAKKNIGSRSFPQWTQHSVVSTRTSARYDNCPNGTICSIVNGAEILVSSDINSVTTGVFNSLDTAGRAIKAFDSGMTDKDDIVLLIDQTSKLPEDITGGSSRGRYDIWMTTDGDAHQDGHRPAHEVGHCLHKREYESDNNVTSCGVPWQEEDLTTEQCASAEGFAGYVAAVSWWDPGVANSAPTFEGRGFETATPIDTASCAGNRGIPLQVMRAFWDLDDATNEAGVSVAAGFDDNRNASSGNILQMWGNMAAGTGNRQRQETDADGPNLWDLTWVTWAGDSSLTWGPYINYETLLYHNCLGAQDEGI